MTPASPVTGSQTPLQQSDATLQSAVGIPHESDPVLVPPPPSGFAPKTLPTHWPALHVPEQQSKPFAQGPPASLHASEPGAPSAAFPGPPHAPLVQTSTQHWSAVLHEVAMLPQVPLRVWPSPFVNVLPSPPASPPAPMTAASSPPQWQRVIATTTNPAHKVLKKLVVFIRRSPRSRLTAHASVHRRAGRLPVCESVGTTALGVTKFCQPARITTSSRDSERLRSPSLASSGGAATSRRS